MTKITAIVLGLAATAALGACADGSSLAAERGALEETVSLDEAVVEVEAAAALELETGLERFAPAVTAPESDIVDLDSASDSG